MRKLTLVAVLVLALVISSFSVFADGEQSILSKVTGLSDDEISELHTQRIGFGQLIPASVLANRLDMDIMDVIALRQAGKTYYQIAVDKGITAEDYKNTLLEKKNEYVDEQVKDGSITEDQGKLIKERMSTNIESCNGQTPGSGKMNGGCGMSGGFGGAGMGGFGRGCGLGRNAQ
jgi:hypothetical protein